MVAILGRGGLWLSIFIELIWRIVWLWWIKKRLNWFSHANFLCLIRLPCQLTVLIWNWSMNYLWALWPLLTVYSLFAKLSSSWQLQLKLSWVSSLITVNPVHPNNLRNLPHSLRNLRSRTRKSIKTAFYSKISFLALVKLV